MLNKVLIPLKAKIIPVVVVRRVLEELCFFIHDYDQWRQVDITSVRAIYLKRYLIFLIDSEDTLFKMLKFPSELLQKRDLKEAVTFEVQSFSPWGEDTEIYYFAKLDGTTWHVQVWIWEKQANVVSDLQSLGLSVTHMMPEHAICLSSLTEGVAAYFLRKNEEYIDAVSISSGEHSISIQRLHSKKELELFFHKAKCYGKLTVMFKKYQGQDDALPGWMSAVEWDSCPVSKMRFDYIRSGRISGGVEWWALTRLKKPLLLLAAMFFLVGMGQFILMRHAEQIIQGRYDVAMQSANHVLSYRHRIEKDQNLLGIYREKKHSQQKLWIALDYMSRNLPDNIRMKGVQYLNGVLTINGDGHDVARLPALLEKSKLIKRSEFIGAINLDPSSGREKFTLRVFLAGKDR